MAVPFTQVQNKTNNSSSNGTTLTITWTNNTTPGNTIFVVFGSGSSSFASVGSITDSVGNTYTKIDAVTNTVDAELWYAKNITGNTTATITINITGGTGNGVAAIAVEYSGLNKTKTLDVHTTSTGTSTTMQTATTTITNQSSELVIVYGCVDSNSTVPTVGAGFGDLLKVTDSSSIYVALQDKTVTSTGTQTGSITVGNTNWAAGIATFMTGNNIQPGMDNRGYVLLRPHAFSPGMAR